MQEPAKVYLFDLLSLTGCIQENHTENGIENLKYAGERPCMHTEEVAFGCKMT